ncbi:MAG: hypothetical protein KF801_02860 [Cryobacterium sp.]|nr:hypothetical protein [Cryobacterium sp.]
MIPARSHFSFAAVVAAGLLLAGCAPAASDTAPGGNPGSPPGSGPADCSAFDGQSDPELMLFTSSAIAAGPEAGQKYGDGTELSITLSKEAMDAGLLPQFELIALGSDGAPVLVSSLAFDPTTGGDGTYSTSSLEFGNDTLVGKPIIAEIFAISDATMDGASAHGDKLLLGNYCMTYANDGS